MNDQHWIEVGGSRSEPSTC